MGVPITCRECGDVFDSQRALYDHPCRQMDLFAPGIGVPRVVEYVPPHTRSTDPDTSHAAAERIRPRVGTQRWRILTYLHLAPGLLGGTSEEIADHYDGKRDSYSPRFRPVADAGLIMDGGDRRDGQIVWLITDAGIDSITDT